MTARIVTGHLQMGNRADRRDRDGRLAEALRANLRRRKAQARDRREQPDDERMNRGVDQGSGQDSGQNSGSGANDQDGRTTSTAETERD